MPRSRSRRGRGSAPACRGVRFAKADAASSLPYSLTPLTLGPAHVSTGGARVPRATDRDRALCENLRSETFEGLPAKSAPPLRNEAQDALARHAAVKAFGATPREARRGRSSP